MIVVDEQARAANTGVCRISVEKKDEVVTMYNNGVPISRIALSCGISRTSVYKIVKERTVCDGIPGEGIDSGGKQHGIRDENCDAD